MNTAAIVALIGAAGVASGGLFAWLSAKRAARGQVNTSEAAVLWQQSQAMMTVLVQQRDRAEAQRDRLIDAQASSVLPSLEAINAGLSAISEGLERNNEILTRIEAGTAGGNRPG